MNISCPEGVTVSGSKDIACSTWITLEKNKSGTLLINFENTSGTEQEIGFSFDLTNKDGSLIQRVFEFVKVPGSKEISPYVKVLSPNGGENLSKGGKYKIEWESKNIEKFDIYLDARWERGGPDRLIAANVKGNTLMWVVPDDIVSSSDPYPSNQTPEQYKINVMQSQGLKEIAGDFSDDFFNIGGSINESKASLVIHSPQGGETFANNQKILIGYAAKNISDTLVAYLYHPEYGQVAEYQEVATMPLGTGKGVIELDLAKYKTIDVIQAGEYKIGLCDPKSTGPGGDKDLCVWSNYFTVTDSSSPLTMCTFNRDLTLGSQGDDVSNLQYFLQTRGYLGTSGEDKGYFGASTQAALIKFKTSIGIYPADGYFGAMTRQKVTEQCLSGLKGSAPAYYSSSSIMSKKDEFELGAKNNVIKKIQQFLNSNGYSIETKAGEPGSSGYETDYFGEKTKQALIRFQKDKGITPAQGYFGPKTKAVMGI
jgi:peptidoglycan hydrolase-like protein with peptidoglycan-binding domain